MCRNLWTWIIIWFCFQYCCMYTVVIVFLTILHQRIAFLLLFHFHIWFDHLFDLCFFNTRIADNIFLTIVWVGRKSWGRKDKKIMIFPAPLQPKFWGRKSCGRKKWGRIDWNAWFLYSPWISELGRIPTSFPRHLPKYCVHGAFFWVMVRSLTKNKFLE